MNTAERQREAIRQKANAKSGNAQSSSTKEQPKKADAKKDESVNQTIPEPKLVPIWFNATNGSFWGLNVRKEYQCYPDSILKTLMRSRGYSDKFRHANGETYLDMEMLRIVHEDCVDFCGPLGGYMVGKREINGSHLLITNSPKIMESKPGKWPIFRRFLSALLGKESKYFLGWMKAARDSLLNGPPWRPGQMLVLGGPEGCGKSHLQELITPMLGGRHSSPYEYMASKTDFNAEIFVAEHGLIGDQNHKTGKGARKAFGAAVKNLTVNPSQRIHGKFKQSITLNAFLRLSLSVNDAPYALQVLPELDEDVRNKMILLQCLPTKVPYPSAEFPSRQSYDEAINKEIPHFLHDLKKWKIPEEIQDIRYGVKSYHSPSITEKMTRLSKEWAFWHLVELYLFGSGITETWSGNALELEKIIRKEAKGVDVETMFDYPGACGSYLSMLAVRMPSRITVEKKGHNLNKYTISKEQEDE